MPLAETAEATVTIVVDNYSDVLLESTPGVDRYTETKEPLLAEHGFCAHIQLGAFGPQMVLDAGASRVALAHNLPRLGVEPGALDQLVISHGHPDHTGSLEILLGLTGRPMPVVVHPDAFLERWRQLSDGSRKGPYQQDRQSWEKAGARIVPLSEPYELAPGCLATGPIPRTTDFEQGTPNALCRREGDAVRDLIVDDQAIVINVQGKGLVIVSGCAHAGIVNTALYAQEISGVDRLWAVVGGFHLDGAAEEKIRRTIAELQALGPELVMPCHCTGFEATRRFAQAMPGQFLLGAVGTTLKF